MKTLKICDDNLRVYTRDGKIVIFDWKTWANWTLTEKDAIKLKKWIDEAIYEIKHMEELK